MENITLVIVSGTIFTLLILALTAIVIFAAQRKKDKLLIQLHDIEINKQKEISENTLVGQENERQRIGMELHDELGPLFAAVRMNMSRIEKLSEHSTNIEKIQNIANQTSDALGKAITQFSDVSRQLYPVVLTRFGIQQALEDIVDKANANSNIQFSLTMDDFSIDKEITKLSVYRICQELSTNAIKHSKASSVQYHVKNRDKVLLLEYYDDGIGYDTSVIHKGLGLNSIKGRTEAVGGSLEINSAPEKGVHIKFVIPNA